MKELKTPHVKMEKLLTNLSEDDQATLQSLLTQYKEASKTYHESLKSAETDEAKNALKQEREITKNEYKEKVVALV